MLKPFAELLPGTSGANVQDRVPALRELHPSLAKCKEAIGLVSRSGSVMAVMAVMARTSGFLGLRPRSVALLTAAQVDGSLSVLGASAPLRMTGLGWEPAV